MRIGNNLAESSFSEPCEADVTTVTVPRYSPVFPCRSRSCGRTLPRSIPETPPLKEMKNGAIILFRPYVAALTLKERKVPFSFGDSKKKEVVPSGQKKSLKPLTEVVLRILVPVVVEAEGAEAALDADGARAQEAVGRRAPTQPTHLLEHVCNAAAALLHS